MMKVFSSLLPPPHLLIPLLLFLLHLGEGFTPSVNAQRSKTSHEVARLRLVNKQLALCGSSSRNHHHLHCRLHHQLEVVSLCAMCVFSVAFGVRRLLSVQRMPLPPPTGEKEYSIAVQLVEYQ